jgi:hypothetical protein
MTRLIGPLNSGAAAGGAGVATANATSSILVSGLLHAVYVKYNDAPPAGTTDVTIATAASTSNAPAQTLLSIANAATDGWFYPRGQIHTTAGAAIADQYGLLPVYDKVKVTIAQANAADNVDVWLLVCDY